MSITAACRRPVAASAAGTLASWMGWCGSHAKAVSLTGTPPIICRPASVVRPTSGMAGSTNASSTPSASMVASISAPSGPRSPVSIFLSTSPAQPGPTSASAAATRRAASAGPSVRLCVLRTHIVPRGAGPRVSSAGCTTTPPGPGRSSAPTSQAPVRSSARTRSASMSLCASGEEHGASGCPVELRELERQADERVAAGLHRAQVEALDHEHTGAEEPVVHREALAAEALDRQVVHADRAHAARHQQVGGVLGEIGEVALELRRLPTAGVVGPAEEDVAVAEGHVLEGGGVEDEIGRAHV